MHRFTAMNLTLACAKTTKEGLQIVVGAITLRPGIAGKETGPTLLKGKADMGDGVSLVGMTLGIILELGKKLLNVAFD